MPRKSNAHRNAKGPTQRQLRVGEVIRHALSTILMREPLRDPVLEGVSITVSEVRASADMRHAKVFCAPLGGENQDEVLEVLNKSSGFLRGQLGQEVSLKYTPQLDFVLDTSFDEADRIRAILRSDGVARDIAAPDEDPSQKE
jgi:ribosome-binding factor A